MRLVLDLSTVQRGAPGPGSWTPRSKVKANGSSLPYCLSFDIGTFPLATLCPTLHRDCFLSTTAIPYVSNPHISLQVTCTVYISPSRPVFVYAVSHFIALHPGRYLPRHTFARRALHYISILAPQSSTEHRLRPSAASSLVLKEPSHSFNMPYQDRRPVHLANLVVPSK